jgi:murein DD-endopeptidase MepM/ murein hydrolase activator NlpD
VPSVVRVKRAVGVLVAVLGMVTLAVTVPAGAASTTTSPEQRQSQIDKELARLRNQIGEASAQQARLIAELQVTRRERAALDVKVAALDGQMAIVQRDLDAVTAELDAAIAAQETAKAALAAAKAKLRKASDDLRKQALSAYMHGNTPSLESALGDLEDIDDAPRVATYIDVAASRQQAVVDEHKKRRQDLDVLEDQASAAKDQVAARQADVASRRAELQRARDEQAAVRNQVAAEADREARLLAQVQAQKSTYLQQVNQLERESGQISFDLARRQRGQTPAPARKGALSYPVARPVITSYYGYRTHPIYGDRRLHAGIDLAASTGMTVMAAAAGTVVTAGWMSGYGYTVVIDHGGATATLYAHNSALAVSPGQSVSRGQRIASAGSTGNSTGPHVHFEVRVKGQPVDPMNYL